MSTGNFSDQQRSSLRAADAQGRVLVTVIENRIVLVLAPTSDDQSVEQIAKIAQVLGAAGVAVDPRPMLLVACSDEVVDYLSEAADQDPTVEDLNEWIVSTLVSAAAEALRDDPVEMLRKFDVGRVL